MGITPYGTYWLDIGQCTTAVLVDPMASISASSSQVAWASTASGPSNPWLWSQMAGRNPYASR